MKDMRGHRSSWAISGKLRQQRNHGVSPEVSKTQTQVSEIPNVQENCKATRPSQLSRWAAWGELCLLPEGLRVWCLRSSTSIARKLVRNAGSQVGPNPPNQTPGWVQAIQLLPPPRTEPPAR